MPRDSDIRFRSGSTTPSAGSFNVGEPAWDSSAGKLYVKNAAGSMVEIGAGGGSAELVYSYATTSAFPATGSASLLYFATDTGRMFRWVDATTKYIEVGSLGGGGLFWGTAPASRDASGAAGSLAYDGSYLYVATGSNTWRRLALTWSEDPYWSSVRGLFHFDNSTTDTSTTGGTWTGSVSYSTSPAKFGTHSLNPNGNYLSRGFSTAYNFGTDFTIECWVYPTSSSGVYGIYGTSGGSGAFPKFVVHLDSLQPKLHLSNLPGLQNNWLSATSSVTVNTWTHIAITRSSGTWSWYINGTRTATGSEAASVTFSNNESTFIGYGGESYFASFAGYLDDLRLTAASRYSGASLTVPTAAFPDY